MVDNRKITINKKKFLFYPSLINFAILLSLSILAYPFLLISWRLWILLLPSLVAVIIPIFISVFIGLKIVKYKPRKVLWIIPLLSIFYSLIVIWVIWNIFPYIIPFFIYNLLSLSVIVFLLNLINSIITSRILYKKSIDCISSYDQTQGLKSLAKISCILGKFEIFSIIFLIIIGIILPELVGEKQGSAIIIYDPYASLIDTIPLFAALIFFIFAPASILIGSVILKENKRCGLWGVIGGVIISLAFFSIYGEVISFFV